MKEGRINIPRKIHVHSQSTAKELNSINLFAPNKLLPKRTITTLHPCMFYCITLGKFKVNKDKLSSLGNTIKKSYYISRSIVKKTLAKTSIKSTPHKFPPPSTKEAIGDECNVDIRELEDHILPIPSISCKTNTHFFKL